MSRLYKDNHRALQDEFGTRKLADRIEELACNSQFDEMSRAIVGSMDMFFLSTVDPEGQPSVSYKGGFPGFVKVVDDTTLVFPSYDGNGMFLSMGNLSATQKVGMLFISFEKPMRLRVHGAATILRDDPLQAEYKDADFLVRVEVSNIFINCPRYVHRFERIGSSRYVPAQDPAQDRVTPLAGWKHQSQMQDVIKPAEAERAQAEGLISDEEWLARLAAGDPLA